MMTKAELLEELINRIPNEAPICTAAVTWDVFDLNSPREDQMYCYADVELLKNVPEEVTDFLNTLG